MSRHQSYRNYDYENDLDEFEGGGYEDDEYDEGGYSDDKNEMSPEDQAQMIAGTAQVRSALGPESSKVTAQQIEEALWHYYYDVEKSVAYLTKQITPKPVKSAVPKKNKSGGDQHTGRTPYHSLTEFFYDMPWLNIPNSRRTVFIEPQRPPGGLLGGTGTPGKVSKLQALAAARKRRLRIRKPSPDDVVLAAQAKASNKKLAATTIKKKAGPEGNQDDTMNGIKAMKVNDTPLPKSKNIDVVRAFEKATNKRNASFVVVGHVDAGKSTLMGRLLLDLGLVDQRTIQKYRKEAERIGKSSFALAWVLDQRSEERSRGVTIDIATNKFETASTSFTILDAPGHRDFIPNMIAGASQADFAILVVDATTGAFEAGLKGQTREHSLLLRSMGVSRIIVAVNKLDTVAWSKERFDEISQQVSGFLAATGFQLKNVSYVPLSGLHGDNLVNKSSDPAASWYIGNTLIAELEHSEPMTRALTKPLRLTISEIFRSSHSPLTISGRIDAGSLQAGDALLVQPSGETAHVKSLELDSEPADWAVAGQNIAIHLCNIDPIHVRVGDIICDPKNPIACVDMFTVKVLAFDVLMPMQVDVHRGRLHAAGQIIEIPALLDKVKGTVLKKKPRIVKPGNVARIVVRMSNKVPLEIGQRVVLRNGGETVAAGLLE